MGKRTNLDFDLMRHKVHIQTKNGRKIDCFVDEYEHGGNSDRCYPDGSGISFIFIDIDGYKTVLYADEIESIEITD